MNDAVGAIETRGYVGLVEASDAMVKAANVEIVKSIAIGGGLITTLIRGDVGSVKAAVEAGKEVANRVGNLAGWRVIPRPAAELVKFFAN
ncbi:MAG: BMC domain-containing protein [Verrucomicrobiales bacterium]|jgi:ethanolamine utilization protein EutM|nr:BMC domain-containing protein [Verrucomicrobiales bacterium]